MGVPKFYRWISERYPKINQRLSFPPDPETFREHFHGDGNNDSNTPNVLPPSIEEPDALSGCGLKPPIDRLYLDMNGILHGCSHNNASQSTSSSSSSSSSTASGTSVEGDNEDGQADGPPAKITQKEIFQNVCYYLDRLVSDIAEPTELVYMAVDGVAPRAKLNQQRSRRYRSGKEGEIERTVYEAHAHQIEQQKKLLAEEPDEINYNTPFEDTTAKPLVMTKASLTTSGDAIQEIQPGRFTGKFETTKDSSSTSSSVDFDPPIPSSSQIIPDDDKTLEDEMEEYFHSNSITPGTPFMTDCTAHLKHFIKYKLTHDPKWQNLTIIFSGSEVPGEGEHKIMDFMREQQQRPDYDPNLGHCIMGQDGDLIMLGLATHEPNLVLLRERVIFDMAKRRSLESDDASLQESLGRYIHSPFFEFLHMGILRDYLAYEFETSNVLPSNPWDIEHTIDDFVFMTFFVGNDFLPHMPALDIADEAFDLLFHTYKQQRIKWLKEIAKDKAAPYLTDTGNIVSGKRLEHFLSAVGSHEMNYYDNKKRTESEVNAKLRKMDEDANRESIIPCDNVMASKEESDRAKYREMLASVAAASEESDPDFKPVLSKKKPVFRPEIQGEEVEAGLLSRMGQLLQNSLSTSTDDISDESNKVQKNMLTSFSDEDMKGRYYYDKLNFTPVDADKHMALRKAYVEGLAWNLKYYYEGCVSWEWYYPYHYGPLLSDLVQLDEILNDVTFDDPGEPLRPFEQLMGCMPPSSAYLLPEAYRWLLTDKSSPIVDFYPESFTVDMNGKRWPWEAVVLLPFIDSKRLIEASRTLVSNEMLSDVEKKRNEFGKPYVFTHHVGHQEHVQSLGDNACFQAIEACTARAESFLETEWSVKSEKPAVFRPEAKAGLNVQRPGYPSLRDVPIQSLWRRRVGINVFGMRSRYLTALLELADDFPEFPAISVLAPKFIGTTVYIGYPYMTEGFVTSISDSSGTFRGKVPFQPWNKDEKITWETTRDAILRRYQRGEGLSGTGGWKIPECDTTLSVRPLKKITSCADGSPAKSFAKFEIQVPLYAAIWSPSRQDPRLKVPALLEKDPFFTRSNRKKGESPSATIGFSQSGTKIEGATSAGLGTAATVEESSVLPPFHEAGAVSSSQMKTAQSLLTDQKSRPGISPLSGIRSSSLAVKNNGFSLSGGRRGIVSYARFSRAVVPNNGFSINSAPALLRYHGNIRGRLLVGGVAAAAALFAP